MNSTGEARPVLSVDVVALSVADQKARFALYSRQWAPQEGCEALPGVMMDYGETVASAAARALSKAGIDVPAEDLTLTPLTYRDNPDRDDRWHTVSIPVLVVLTAEQAEGGSWTGLSEIGDLAFDHDVILDEAVEVFREGLMDTPEWLTACFGEEVTSSEMTSLWYSVEGPVMNTWRTMTSSRYLEDSGRVRRDGPGRPTRVWAISKNID